MHVENYGDVDMEDDGDEDSPNIYLIGFLVEDIKGTNILVGITITTRIDLAHEFCNYIPIKCYLSIHIHAYV